MTHPGLLAVDGVVAITIKAREASFAYVILSERLAENLSAIRHIDRGAEQPGKNGGTPM